MDQKTAAQTLQDLDQQQRHARRAAATPWWFYVATFVVVAAICASNDFLSGTGSRIVALVVMVGLVAVIGLRLATRSAPLRRARGVQQAASRSPRSAMFTMIIGGLVGWLFALYGVGFGVAVADALHLSHYPYTVTGVIAGVLFTGILMVVEVFRGGSMGSTRRRRQ